MNYKRNILTTVILLQGLVLFSQRIDFTYDNNGNRSSRTLYVEQLRSNTVEFPVTDLTKLKSAQISEAESLDNSLAKGGESIESANSYEQEVFISDEAKIITVVYPNPSKGLLRIGITNMPINSITELRLYDLNGNELLIQKNFENQGEVDISDFKDGIYILRIQINNKFFDWKVIKQN